MLITGGSECDNSGLCTEVQSSPGISCLHYFIQTTSNQAEDGHQISEGCLHKTCNEGVWRTSLAGNLCCYERAAYTINTTISSSMSEDGCVRAAIDCVEETPGIAKTILLMENFCKNYATKEQVEELKNLLVNQIEGCQGEIEGGNMKQKKRMMKVSCLSLSELFKTCQTTVIIFS